MATKTKADSLSEAATQLALARQALYEARLALRDAKEEHLADVLLNLEADVETVGMRTGSAYLVSLRGAP